jgi:LPS-assembly protein
MKNKFKILNIILFFFTTFYAQALSEDQFNFDVTEVEITEQGNRIKGVKRGTITTNDGIIFDADEFDYDKLLNIFVATGNVQVLDTIENIIIFTDKATYLKNKQEIFTQGKSKAISNNDSITIKANNFRYNKISRILNANKNVEIDDPLKEFKLNTQDVTYFINEEKIITKGETNGVLENKYNFFSSDVLLNRNSMELSSFKKSSILDDKSNYYKLDEFKYYINTEFLKGKNVKITTNNNLEKNGTDEYFFLDSFIDLKNQNFKSSKTEIKMHKNMFGEEDNDPRIYGASSTKLNEITKINKAVFTSCKQNDKCPPWSIQAKNILHNKEKKQLIYNDAVLKVYNMPVLYFPKFFHPDPTVRRQSGFLQPQLNNSKILGTSSQIPYFHVISENQDYTFTPAIFDSNIYMLQNEYRHETKNSTLIADFALTKGYQSQLYKKKNSISHLFSKFYLDLDLKNFIKSDLDIKVEKVTNDTYLKLFDSNLMKSLLKPGNKGKMTSYATLSLDHKDYDFNVGITAYEKLSGKNSDRYQFVLPSYDFSKDLYSNPDLGTLNFASSGSNNLKDTNNLKSRIYNNINLNSSENYFKSGITNNFNLYLKNINTVAKNDTVYKSSLQSELVSIFETQASLPLIKYGDIYNDYIVPKVSFRFNPSDMKKNSGNRRIDTNNLFSINRLGISDSFEPGKSMTIGLEYKKESIDDLDKYFDFKVGAIFRDTFEDKISSASTIDKKISNIFGSTNYYLSDMFTFNYDYSIDKDFKTIEYNALGGELFYKKFSTEVLFIEENGNVGNSNSILNKLSYKFDKNNFLTFNTRRNRKIGLTEYYDLVYEYRNDCLIAGIKYNKKYYKDRDVMPTEDLLFTVTLFPLTTYEKSFDRNK